MIYAAAKYQTTPITELLSVSINAIANYWCDGSAGTSAKMQLPVPVWKPAPAPATQHQP
jgi:hypothetical protein